MINDGTVISLANPNSMDGGIDSDMGTSINGGTVIGAGSMYDPLENNSEQLFMFLQFAENTDNLIVVTDEKDVPIFAYDLPYDYTYISFSTPTLTEGTYHVYKGGDISGTEQDGLYSTITSYSSGIQLHHGDTSLNGGKGDRPDMNDNSERPAPPEGMENSGRPNSFGGNMQSSSDTESYDFVLTSSSRGFTDVASNSWYTEAIKFSDTDPTAYYYDAVLWANQEDITKGIDTNTFGVGQSITLKDAITMFNRYEQNTNFTTLIENATSSEPATRAQIAFLLMRYYNR